MVYLVIKSVTVIDVFILFQDWHGRCFRMLPQSQRSTMRKLHAVNFLQRLLVVQPIGSLTRRYCWSGRIICVFSYWTAGQCTMQDVVPDWVFLKKKHHFWLILVVPYSTLIGPPLMRKHCAWLHRWLVSFFISFFFFFCRIIVSRVITDGPFSNARYYYIYMINWSSLGCLLDLNMMFYVL